MRLFIILACLLCLVTGKPSSNLCRDIASGIDRPDADLEQIKECNEESVQLSESMLDGGDDESKMQYGKWDWFLKLYCVEQPWLTCTNKCVLYKVNVFGCHTCECRRPRANEHIEGDILLTTQTFHEMEEVYGIPPKVSDPGTQMGASNRVSKWTADENGYYVIPYKDNTRKCIKHVINLSYENYHWCPMDTDGVKEIELGSLTRIGGIKIDGVVNRDAVTISYKDYGGYFQTVKSENGEIEEFDDDAGLNSEKEWRFSSPVETTLIKIEILMNDDLQACVTIEVTGCDGESQESVQSSESMFDGGDDESKMQYGKWDWFLKLYCVEQPWLTCTNKCVLYKVNVFGCHTCECRRPRANEHIEGDILLTGQTFQEMEEVYGIPHKVSDPGIQMGASNRVSKWTADENGYYVIPYKDNTRNSKATKAIKQAIKDMEGKTCLRFRRKTRNDRSYINFIRDGGCYSPVGKQSNGNSVSIGRNCEVKGIVIHEILHSIGFWHEQSRPDRDEYVRIITQNIRNGLEYNFRKQKARDIDSFGSKYDIKSLMHYDGYAFSKNGKPTIVEKKTNKPIKSQRDELSEEDLEQINAMYPDCRTKPTTTTTTLTSKPAPNCRDGASNCRDFVEYCGDGYRVMELYCKNTCNTC